MPKATTGSESVLSSSLIWSSGSSCEMKLSAWYARRYLISTLTFVEMRLSCSDFAKKSIELRSSP